MTLQELIRRLLEVQSGALLENPKVFVGNLRVEQVIKIDAQRMLIIPEDPFKGN